MTSIRRLRALRLREDFSNVQIAVNGQKDTVKRYVRALDGAAGLASEQRAGRGSAADFAKLIAKKGGI